MNRRIDHFWLALALWLCLLGCSQKSSIPESEEAPPPSQETPVGQLGDDDEEMWIILDEPAR